MTTEKQIRDATESLLNARDYMLYVKAAYDGDTKTRRLNDAIDNIKEAAEALGYVLVEKDDGK